MSRYTTQPAYDGGGGLGIASNASFVGQWIHIEDVDALAFQVQVAGTGNPTAAWDLDVTDDFRADKKNGNDAALNPPFTTTTRTSEMTAANPAGAGVAINALLGFYQGDTNRPMPRAKFARLKLTVSGGGSASAGSVKIGESQRGQ